MFIIIINIIIIIIFFFYMEVIYDIGFYFNHFL